MSIFFRTLGPNQEKMGMVEWWMMWRVESWLVFFRSTKKMESAKSINLEK
jgi:hypothetical protein